MTPDETARLKQGITMIMEQGYLAAREELLGSYPGVLLSLSFVLVQEALESDLSREEFLESLASIYDGLAQVGLPATPPEDVN